MQQLPFFFCFGNFSPLGQVSFTVEWRDYILGLDAIGVPVRIVDLFTLSNLIEVSGPLAIAYAARKFAVKAGAIDRLAQLNRPDMRVLSFHLSRWLESRGSTNRHYSRELETFLPQPLALKIESGIADGLRLAFERLRAKSTTTGGTNEKDLRDVSAIMKRTGQLDGVRRATAIVDYIDFQSWGGPVLKRAFEHQIRDAIGATEIRWIVRAMSETDAVPPSELRALGHFDEVWVPSEFHRSVFEKATIQIRVVPMALDTRRYRPDAAPKKSRCTFLVVSNHLLPSKVQPQYNEVRKATDLTLRAFCQEFAADEAVSLLLKVSDPDETRKRLRTFLEQIDERPKRLDQITIVGQLGQNELARLYRASTALINVTRGEGWGRPMMEAMACGTAAIGTRFGGNLAFMSDETSYLVDCKLVKVSRDLPAYHAYGRWAEPSLPHLRKVLRQIFEDIEGARRKGKRASREILKRYSRPTVARDILYSVSEPLRKPTLTNRKASKP